MVKYGIALDIGTSGLRAQAIELETNKTVAISITQRHPIPGMNVIDHVSFAMKSGRDLANKLIIGSVNDIFTSLDIDLSAVKNVAVCGNPFQLSLFQNIEIRDLAYAGKNRLKTLGVVPPSRDGVTLKASDLGIEGMPNAVVMIPPAVTHEIGADAMAMIMITKALEETEPCIIVDYGTNAEMALIVDGKIITGSAAAGPALEGQQIERGMLAAPGAIADINITEKGWECFILDENMIEVPGDTINPQTGEVIIKSNMHGKAKGITGTGVIAALACGIESGIVTVPNIESKDGKLHLQDGVCIASRDIDEAGKAIGALRAGFLTLLHEAGLWTGDVKKAYMSGASGLYVDAKKALSVGMVIPGAENIVQFGNTSIQLARQLTREEISIEELREFAKKLRAMHCMFATSEVFKNIYSIEYSLWSQGMPMSEYNNMLAVYNLPPLENINKNPHVEKVSLTDLPDADICKVKILEDTGATLYGEIKDCIMCGLCVRECPEKALEISFNNDSNIAFIHSDRCAGTACKRCERACKRDLLDLSSFKISLELQEDL